MCFLQILHQTDANHKEGQLFFDGLKLKTQLSLIIWSSMMVQNIKNHLFSLTVNLVSQHLSFIHLVSKCSPYGV